MNVEDLQAPGTGYWIFVLGIAFFVASYSIVMGPGINLIFVDMPINPEASRQGYFWTTLLGMGVKTVFFGVPTYWLWKLITSLTRLRMPPVLYRTWFSMVFMAFGFYGLLIKDEPKLHSGGRFIFLLALVVPLIALVRFHYRNPVIIRAGGKNPEHSA